MSFRKEEKIHIHKNQLHNFLGWIYKNNGFKLHDNRIVSSTYLDNDQMRMFIDSEEGNLPRKKIRIRSYTEEPHNIGKSALEIKTSSVEGRYKSIDRDFNLKKIMAIGFFDKDYGVCKPKARVTYKREYYRIHNIRLTVDRHIKYIKLNPQGRGVYKNTESDIIVEIKAGDYVPVEYLLKEFYFDRIRFSKYAKAINSFL